MNFKKSYFALGLLALSSFAINSVSAFGPNLKELLGQSSNLARYVDFIFGNQANSDIVTVLLMFALTALVIYGLLESGNLFGSSTKINGWISVIVSLIGIRFLPTGFLSTIATPSSALVAIIVGGTPFLILLQITRKEQFRPFSSWIWGIYAVLCFILGVYNIYKNVSSEVNLFGWNMSIISAVFIILGIIGVIFALFWRYIVRAQRKMEDKEDIAAADKTAVRAMKNRLDEVNDRLKFLSGRTGTSAVNEQNDLLIEKNKLEKDIATFEKTRD